MAEQGKFECRALRDRVILHFEGYATSAVSWQEADMIYRILKLSCRGIVGEAHARIRMAGQNLHLVMQPSVMWEIAAAIYQVTRLVEEYVKVEKVVLDSALLIRSGAPLALSDNPKVQEMAVQEALHNRALRRVPMRGIPSAAAFGVPRVVRRGP